jgi:hypothetical protein
MVYGRGGGIRRRAPAIRHVYEFMGRPSQSLKLGDFPEVSGFPVVYRFSRGGPIFTKNGIPPFFALGRMVKILRQIDVAPADGKFVWN